MALWSMTTDYNDMINLSIVLHNGVSLYGKLLKNIGYWQNIYIRTTLLLNPFNPPSSQWQHFRWMFQILELMNPSMQHVRQKFIDHLMPSSCIQGICTNSLPNWCSMPREGTPILGHGREVPRWGPLFLRF